MKKLAVVAVVLSLCLMVSVAFAGTVKGVVKSVDAKAGTIVVTVDGKDESFKAGKGVDLGKFKAGDKVEVSADKDTATEIKIGVAKPKAAVGC